MGLIFIKDFIVMCLHFIVILRFKNYQDLDLTNQQLKTAFANCLKELRRYKGYTLKQVADATGIPIATVQRYENCENTPGIIHAFKFSQFYKIDIENMFLAGYLDEDSREQIFDDIIKK